MKESFNKPTKDYFEAAGWIYIPCEHYNAFAGKTQDFAGFADAIALLPARPGLDAARPTARRVAVQICRESDWTTRRKKIIGNGKALAWLLSDNEIWIVSWAVEKVMKPNKLGRIQLQRECSMNVHIIDPSDFQSGNEITLEHPRNTEEALRTHRLLRLVFRGA